MTDETAKFWAQVHKADDGCWLWDGSSSGRYGRFYTEGRSIPAHRFSYETTVGVIPPGLQIDHLCRTPRCVRPDHLEVVTGRVNTLRGFGPTAANARKTHCLRGHEFNAENMTVTKRGDRCCQLCRRLSDQFYKQRDKKEKARERAWWETNGDKLMLTG